MRFESRHWLIPRFEFVIWCEPVALSQVICSALSCCLSMGSEVKPSGIPSFLVGKFCTGGPVLVSQLPGPCDATSYTRPSWQVPRDSDLSHK